ncbi:4'-phosphopantetheinyl transferase superfamily protein [Prolixibacteraceae bacterium JC049]|nr:4'-phosphopantetheinyl transferase superfamily protein [Prolixibacteraceae bacterium JC049]
MAHLFTRNMNESSTLLAWELNESIEELLPLAELTEDEKHFFSSIKNEQRKREWLVTRVLLLTFLNRKVEVDKTAEGKPFLKNEEWNISISHTSTMVLVLFSKMKSIGVDVEKINRKIDRVAPRFLSTKELANCDTDDKQRMLVCHWCAKEAVFKAIDDTDIDFSEQIHIQGVRLDNSEGVANWQFFIDAKKDKEGTILFYFEKEHCIAVTLN